MRSSFAAILQGFTLPFGRTSGRRIVFDGPNGSIRFYDTLDRLRLEISTGLPSQILFYTGDAQELGPGSVSSLSHIVSGETYESLRLGSPHNSLDGGANPEGSQIELRSRSEDGSEPAMVALMAKISTQDLRLGILDDSSGNRNQPLGLATLVAGTVTVTHACVSANSRIIPWHQTAGGTMGHLSIANVVAGTSFDIVSDNAADTSTVGYLMIEPL